MRQHDLHEVLVARSGLMTFQAVNALLTAIDRLRSWPNVTVFCTSNLIKAVVRNSSEFAAYELSIFILD